MEFLLSNRGVFITVSEREFDAHMSAHVDSRKGYYNEIWKGVTRHILCVNDATFSAIIEKRKKGERG